MHTLSAEALDNLVRDILLAAGADERNAGRVAEALVPDGGEPNPDGAPLLGGV
jgi:LDH2 family malate/lactate/ureidoglycolate dehydrogenase